MKCALKKSFNDGSSKLKPRLTKREIMLLRLGMIFGLIGEGHPDKSIGDRLGISEDAVGNRLRSAFVILGAKGRTNAYKHVLSLIGAVPQVHERVPSTNPDLASD